MAAALSMLPFAACGGSDDQGVPGEASAASGDGPVHVHGLGINPRDRSLYIATHTGLFRAPNGETEASRVGESEQDVMGFSVLGPDSFLGSGHPGPLQSGPSNLGLIRSDNAGDSWEPVSLMGEADFHVLRSKRNMVYGFNATSGALMVSRDRGRNWDEHNPPGAMLDLAIDPADPSHVVASTEQGLVASADAGRTWQTLVEGKLALLTWPARDQLYSLDGTGQIAVSHDSGRSWQRRGSMGAQPAAFASGGHDLYAALPDGTVKRSIDGGTVWSVRTTS
ncbi:MAG: F510_1955 family glycosylhydrolase [Thermoleophilaceae bacterium]